MVFSADPAIESQTVRLAANVATISTTLQADSVKLASTMLAIKQGATALLAQSAQLKKTAPGTTAQDIVNYLDQLIKWLQGVVSWAHGANWWGWLNWFINDVNSAITDIQNLVNWVNAHKSAINTFGTIVSDAVKIIGWVETLLSWL